jgi:septum formation protein
MELILGSQSPRRKEILSYFSIPFVQVPSEFDEDSIVFQDDPEQYVAAISQAKAAALSTRFPQSVILTADTTVYCNDKIYGKPSSEEEAFQRLSELVGQWHTVYTGVTVQHGDQIFHQVETSHVQFNPLSPEQIRRYLAKTQWADKAGGYAIQMPGGLLVRKIYGCYYNIMGLPINAAQGLLKKAGIELWSYL